MAHFRPALDELGQLVEPLNDAEREVADALTDLDDDWTIYIQPRIGLDRPDFVAVHDRLGVCVVEVKGWNANLYRQRDDGVIECRVRGGGWEPTTEQPRYQALRYRRAVWDQAFAGPADPEDPNSQVRSIVVFPRLSTKEAEQIIGKPAVTREERSIRVLGGNALKQAVVQAGNHEPCTPPRNDQLARLERQLTPSALNLQLTDGQWRSAGAKNIERNPKNARMRRVKGAAGSGKTYGLCARAARLAADGKDVLVLCYNRTLTHYLRMLIDARCDEAGANRTRVTCTTFHAVCSRLVDEAERHGHQLPKGVGAWHEVLVQKATAAAELGVADRYAAVLVDEGQDFELDWWNLLRQHLLMRGGEMLLAADPTQDLYDKAAWTDEEQMLGAGFSGKWTVLTDSHRIPGDLVSVLGEYAAAYVPGDRVFATMPTESHEVECNGSRSTSVRTWVNIDRSTRLGHAVGTAVVELLDQYPQLSPSDVAFLAETHTVGLAAVKVIEDAGHDVHHVFAELQADQQRRKRRFWPDTPGVRGSTIHSFKGWESRAVVVGIGQRTGSPRLGYVALTRVLGCGYGTHSFAAVVNQNARLFGFENTFCSWQPPHAPLRLA